ncbi:MAG: sigma-70 family RNA polymerase sigma factor [Muribaculaceae bacterium]|nr:sigma-70 family RNA polymerase sigma factor [Muribaculaceae bacterium]
MERDFIISAFRSVRRRLLSRRADDDEDALQEAFCRLWTRRAEFSSQGEAEGFLTLAARNVSIDHHRRRQAHPEMDIDTIDRHPTSEEDTDSQLDKIAQINRLIETHLSERDREILRCHDRDGWDFEEIAEYFGITQANARMIVSRSRKTIRTLYQNTQHTPCASSRTLGN